MELPENFNPLQPEKIQEFSSDTLTNFYCRVCDVEYDSHGGYTSHINSLMHQMKLIVIYRNSIHSNDEEEKSENNDSMSSDQASQPMAHIDPEIEVKKTLLSHHSQSSNKPSRQKQCTECNKIIIGGLSRHMRRHSGDNPFTCSKCGDTFNQSSNCARHIRAVHHKRNQTAYIKKNKSLSSKQSIKVSPEKFTCKLCHKIFFEKSSYTRHTKESIWCRR